MIGGQAGAASGDPKGAGDGIGGPMLLQEQIDLPAPDLLALEAVVNGQRSGSVFVYVGDGAMAIDEESLRRWRIEIPAGAAREIEGRRYVPITALDGVAQRLSSGRSDCW